MRIAVVAVCFLTGCTATSLARIQHTYNDLMQQSEQLRDTNHKPLLGNAASAKPDSKDAALATTQRDLERAFLTLAQEAQESADKATDPRTQVALLRTAGFAAWQAGEQGLEESVKIETLGVTACNRMAEDAKRFGAPRDCAILRGIGALAASGAVGRRVATLEAAHPNSAIVPIASAPAVSALIEPTMGASRRVSQAAKDAAVEKGVDQSVTDYYNHQVVLSRCNQLSVFRMAENLQQPNSTTLAEVAKAMRAQKDEVVKAARAGFCTPLEKDQPLAPVTCPDGDKSDGVCP